MPEEVVTSELIDTELEDVVGGAAKAATGGKRAATVVKVAALRPRLLAASLRICKAPLMTRRRPFEGFSLHGFWNDVEWAKASYVERKPSPAVVASVESELGYTLPWSYVWLMTRHNGGVPVRSCFPTKRATSWARDHVAITGIAGIGRTKRYSLCGEAGTRFWIDRWGYPPIGVVIANCPSGGHDLIMLDYRKCGLRGEPTVVHVDQEHDYRITPLAEDFETFVRGLVDPSQFEEDEDELTAADLAKVRRGKLSPTLRRLCAAAPGSEAALRSIAERVVSKNHSFVLHGDPLSREMYDAVLWLYAKAHAVFTRERFLADYEEILALAGEFSTGGYAPAFVTRWFGARTKDGTLVRKPGGVALSKKAAREIERRLLGTMATRHPDDHPSEHLRQQGAAQRG